MPEVRILRKWVDDPEQYTIARAMEHGYYSAARKALTEMQPEEII